MSVLTALQSAAVKLVSRKPTTFFQSTDTLEVELCDLVNDVARDIADAHDWRSLMTLKTYTGDGTTTAFALPDDYDRMPTGQEVHSGSWEQWRYVRAKDPNEWQDILSDIGLPHPGAWFILQDQFLIYPAVPASDVAKFYYQSENFALDEDGAPKVAFTADTDTFRLDERLLTLGVVWRWRQQKRLEYAEDMATFERALAGKVKDDKGARVIASGPRRFPGDGRISYPGSLG